MPENLDDELAQTLTAIYEWMHVPCLQATKPGGAMRLPDPELRLLDNVPRSLVAARLAGSNINLDSAIDRLLLLGLVERKHSWFPFDFRVWQRTEDLFVRVMVTHYNPAVPLPRVRTTTLDTGRVHCQFTVDGKDLFLIEAFRRGDGVYRRALASTENRGTLTSPQIREDQGGAFILTKAGLKAVMDIVTGNRSPKPVEKAGGKRDGRRKGRIKREVAEPLIFQHLIKRPHDTARQVAIAAGCSAGVVSESPTWRLNRRRLEIARKLRTEPTSIQLNEKAVNEAGGSQMTQLHDHRQQVDALDDELDQREKELFKQIGEYQEAHPDETPQQVASAVGCTADDVERRQAMLARIFHRFFEFCAWKRPQSLVECGCSRNRTPHGKEALR